MNTFSTADNHNISELLETIQKDLKTLEKAVYQKSDIAGNTISNFKSDGLNEDILTKHLLKLNEIEDQFRELTNKFDEIYDIKMANYIPKPEISPYKKIIKKFDIYYNITIYNVMKIFVLIFILISNVGFTASMGHIGEKGKASEVDRVIQIKMYDNYFEPNKILSLIHI